MKDIRIVFQIKYNFRPIMYPTLLHRGSKRAKNPYLDPPFAEYLKNLNFTKKMCNNCIFIHIELCFWFTYSFKWFVLLKIWFKPSTRHIFVKFRFFRFSEMESQNMDFFNLLEPLRRRVGYILGRKLYFIWKTILISFICNKNYIILSISSKFTDNILRHSKSNFFWYPESWLI